jgi:hypothetical protein
MSIVALLSMWISATSCVAILVPVVCAIIDEIHEVFIEVKAGYFLYHKSFIFFKESRNTF